MSQNKLPDTFPSVERFIQRTIQAEKTNQREIRMTLEEAKDIVTDLSILTSKLGKHIKEIHEKLDKIAVQSNQVSINMDGGTF
jgi:septation ring formation regulator EzrA